MVEWNSGHYMADGTWQFVDRDFEIVVAGTIAMPDSHWLTVAQETLSAIEAHHKAARDYLDAFVDRTRFSQDADWEPQSVEFGLSDSSPAARFVLYYRLSPDQYGLWSVAFHGTGLASPHDLYPSKFQREQQ